MVAELGATQPPEEALSSIMRTHFADRMEEKQDMLRQFRDGTILRQVPAPAPDRDMAELPSVVDAADRTTRAEPRRKPWLIAGGAIAALVLAVFFGDRFVSGSSSSRDTPREEPTAASTTVARASTEESAAEDEDPAGAATADEARSVEVRVRSTPPGAEVVVAGEMRGTTPVVVELPRGSTAVPVNVSLDGYYDEARFIVPNAAQDVDLALRRVRARRARSRRSRMAGPEMSPPEMSPPEMSPEMSPPPSEPEPDMDRTDRFERFN